MIATIAYRQGQRAYDRGERLGDNPHAAGTDDHDRWRDGWNNACCGDVYDDYDDLDYEDHWYDD